MIIEGRLEVNVPLPPTAPYAASADDANAKPSTMLELDNPEKGHYTITCNALTKGVIIVMAEHEEVQVEIEESEEGTTAQVEVEITPAGDAADQSEDKSARGRTTKQLREALRQAESFAQALSEALQGRGNVVMVRVNDEALAHLDMLVEAEITKSRSESAAFLISEGIKANQALFDKIRAITEQIMELREQLRREVALTSAEDKVDDKKDTPSSVD